MKLTNQIQKLNYNYNIDVDSLYIKKNDEYTYEISQIIGNNIILDISNLGELVAIEILQASEILEITKDQLNKIKKIFFNINTNEDVIKFNILIHTDEEKGQYRNRILNEYNSPYWEYTNTNMWWVIKMIRFENRLNKKNIKFNTLNPVWDNQEGIAINVFEMINLLNELDDEKRELQFTNNNLENALSDFINILNRLQADNNNEQLLNIARDMLMNMDVELL